MSRKLRVTISDAYANALEQLAMEEGQFTGERANVSALVRTAIRKYLHRRGYSKEDIDKPDRKKV